MNTKRLIRYIVLYLLCIALFYFSVEVGRYYGYVFGIILCSTTIVFTLATLFKIIGILLKED